MLLLLAVNSISSGNLFGTFTVFDGISNTVCKIVGDNIVTIGNAEIFPLQHIYCKAKASSLNLCHTLLNG